jgi:hypothetical protein
MAMRKYPLLRFIFSLVVVTVIIAFSLFIVTIAATALPSSSGDAQEAEGLVFTLSPPQQQPQQIMEVNSNVTATEANGHNITTTDANIDDCSAPTTNTITLIGASVSTIIYPSLEGQHVYKGINHATQLVLLMQMIFGSYKRTTVRN